MNWIFNFSVDPSVQQSVQNIATPSWDTFLIIFFATSTILYGFFVSRERLAVVLLSVYSALAIVQNTPVVLSIIAGYEQQQLVWVRLGAFVVLFLVLYVLLSHNMTLHSEIAQWWWRAFLLSLLQVGLLMSTILSFIPKATFTSSFSEYVFTSDTARSVWLLAPIVAMLFMRARHHGGGAPKVL